jgi:hypothetical protein
MALALSRKDLVVRNFELSLQTCDSLKVQKERMEEDPEGVLKEVAKVAVKILDFKKAHSSYVVPKSFSLGMCIHHLKNECRFSGPKNKMPCLNPHSFMLKRAAEFIWRMNRPRQQLIPCRSGVKCHIMNFCKYLHGDDVLIYQHVQDIFAARLLARSASKKGPEEWTSVTKGSHNALSAKEARRLMPTHPFQGLTDNPFESLEIDEDLESPDLPENTSPDISPSDDEYDAKDVSSVSPVADSPQVDSEVQEVAPLSDEELDAHTRDVVGSVFNAVFDLDDTEDEEFDEPAPVQTVVPGRPRELVPFFADSGDDHFESLE